MLRKPIKQKKPLPDGGSVTVPVRKPKPKGKEDGDGAHHTAAPKQLAVCDEIWVAKIGSLFDIMGNPAARMCQFNAPDGCPELSDGDGSEATTTYPLPSAPYLQQGRTVGS
eukprot:Skav216320  [mRNA]  locus=scaffold3892:67643:71029:- [translate_table: standard]